MKCNRCKDSVINEKGWTCKRNLNENDDIKCLLKHNTLFLNGVQIILKQINKSQEEVLKEIKRAISRPSPGDEWKNEK